MRKMKDKYSGKEINRAGDTLVVDATDDLAFFEAMEVLSYWRFSHEESLELALSKVEKISRKIDKEAIFAKRLKRYPSILLKLQRFEKMKLKTMQDIGGCRAIVSSEKKLRKIVRELKKLPELKVSTGKYRTKEYIKFPKADGYRSYHLVGRFKDSKGVQKNIEIQLRTRIQHYWATALEIVDMFTGQALKSNQGDEEWKVFFRSISEQFVLMESIHLFERRTFQNIFVKYFEILKDNEDELLNCFDLQILGKKLGVVDKLEAFANSLRIIDDQLNELQGTGYVLLEINIIKKSVSSTLFQNENSKDAEDAYITSEKSAAGKNGIVVALVSSTAVGGIKEAYPNYFADSTNFLILLNLVNNVKNPKQRGLFERLIGA